jgi:hypothetical protein
VAANEGERHHAAPEEMRLRRQRARGSRRHGADLLHEVRRQNHHREDGEVLP